MSSTTPAQDRAAVRARTDLKGAWTGLDQSSVMGVELLSAILLWTGVGHLVDRWLGTDPWFLAFGALLGFAAGLYLVFLRSGRMEAVEIAAREERS